MRFHFIFDPLRVKWVMTKQIITIDIGASKIKFQTIDSEGKLSSDKIISIFGLKIDSSALMQIIIVALNKIIKGKENGISAISLAFPGLIDSDNRAILKAPNLNKISAFNPVEELERIYNLPVYLINDASAGGLGEYWLGAGMNNHDFFYLTFSSGVGGEHLINGNPTGNLEPGHISLDFGKDMRPCGCGGQDHAESFLGTMGLARTYAEVFGIDPGALTMEDSYYAAYLMKSGVEKKDDKWLEVQRLYVSQMVSFLNKIVAKYQPGSLILGGGIVFNNIRLFDELNYSYNQSVGAESETKILLAKFESNVNFGAAKYAFDLLKTRRP
jgi:glucokinase